MAAAGLASQSAGSDLRVEDVHYSYPNGTEALRGLDLSIPRGIVHGVVGPSGCGKSTLLHMLAGLSVPTAGAITIPSADAGNDRLTMVFQKDTLLPWLTVAQNVGVYFRFHQAADPTVRDRVAWLLELVGLDQFANHYPYQLSGGMRRRVAFLSAVAPQPTILLLDEPFSSLDEPTRVAIHQDVHEIIRRLGMTVILVTHDLAEAITLCDSVSILTARPARLAAAYPIPFGDNRVMLDLRQQPLFLELYGTLWRDLSQQIAKSASA
jgi:NitT/TauT family transport system ATP-binding protein